MEPARAPGESSPLLTYKVFLELGHLVPGLTRLPSDRYMGPFVPSPGLLRTPEQNSTYSGGMTVAVGVTTCVYFGGGMVI
jgi:hypothetical protein